jgi:triosephosphate isomerase
MAQADVDGALVGGASLDPDEFVAICRYYQRAESDESAGADAS